MGKDRDFRLCESYDIDNGELDGLTPQKVFVLGVEYQMFLQELDDGDPFERQVHGENVARMKAAGERRGRTMTDHWLHEDYPQWRVLEVS